MLRAEVKSRTPLGLEARRYLDAGDLIPDEVVLAMVASRLDRDDTRTRGFVLDGFPRTVAQADGFDELLKPAEIDLVLNLVDPDRARAGTSCEPSGLRGLRRRSTRHRSPPKVNWTCDVCGGEVVQREDDTEEAIKNRLELYDSSTAPLVARYDAAGQARRRLRGGQPGRGEQAA